MLLRGPLPTLGPEHWCTTGTHRRKRGAKRRYATIEEAWLDAFLLFVRYGDVMTPYSCQPTKKAIARITIIPHPNPWSWLSWWCKRDTRALARAKSCGGWHLTRKCVDFILAKPVASAGARRRR